MTNSNRSQPPPDTTDGDDGEDLRDGHHIRSAIGSVKQHEESAIIEFYAVNECNQERCPIYLHCFHLKKRRPCQIQVKYLRGINDMILEDIDIHELTAIQRLKIGFHLQPLYRSLCRLKMEELSLIRPTQLTNVGSRAVHPVYREIRETIKVITGVLKDLGIDQGKTKKDEEGYYEGLFGEGEKPALKLRKKK